MTKSSKSTTTTTETVEIVTVKSKALSAELGRRRNNKARRAKGEPVAKAAAYYFRSLSSVDVASLLDGETVRKSFASGRVIDLVVADA